MVLSGLGFNKIYCGNPKSSATAIRSAISPCVGDVQPNPCGRLGLGHHPVLHGHGHGALPLAWYLDPSIAVAQQESGSLYPHVESICRRYVTLHFSRLDVPSVSTAGRQEILLGTRVSSLLQAHTQLGAALRIRDSAAAPLEEIFSYVLSLLLCCAGGDSGRRPASL